MLDFGLAPALLVLVTALGAGLLVYIVLSQQLALEARRQNAELRLKAFTTAMPLKLQAYERLILFLERMHPISLVPRAEPAQKSARLLLEQLRLEVNSEFEHNVVQQLYLKQATWQRVLMAKDAVLTLLELSYQHLGDKTSGLDFAQAILDRVKAMEAEFPTAIATAAIRSELQELLAGV